MQLQASQLTETELLRSDNDHLRAERTQLQEDSGKLLAKIQAATDLQVSVYCPVRCNPNYALCHCRCLSCCGVALHRRGSVGLAWPLE